MFLLWKWTHNTLAQNIVCCKNIHFINKCFDYVIDSSSSEEDNHDINDDDKKVNNKDDDNIGNEKDGK